MVKIFLDMDGVLVDFDKGLEQFNIQNDTTFIHRPRSEWTELQVRLDHEVVDCMNQPGFFRTLPMMPGAFELWQLSGKDRCVLTARPSTCLDKERVGREKLEWIEDQFGQIPEGQFIYCERNEKAEYAVARIESDKRFRTVAPEGIWGSREISYTLNWEPNVLVDDMEANCSAWEKAGGKAILFKNMNQAVTELRKAIA